MLALPFPDASFDTALSMQVLEHVREPWTAVSEMARILRPGGTAIVSVPFVYPFHSDPHDYFRYSEEGLKSLFERSGLKIILCGKYGGWWAVQGETFKQRFVSPYKKPHPRWKRRLMSAVEWICSALNRMAPPGIVYANVICVAQKPA
jgi:SAM-dependent methyltransferase